VCSTGAEEEVRIGSQAGEDVENWNQEEGAVGEGRFGRQKGPVVAQRAATDAAAAAADLEAVARRLADQLEPGLKEAEDVVDVVEVVGG
jgi:hypothetical protein